MRNCTPRPLIAVKTHTYIVHWHTMILISTVACYMPSFSMRPCRAVSLILNPNLLSEDSYCVRWSAFILTENLLLCYTVGVGFRVEISMLWLHTFPRPGVLTIPYPSGHWTSVHSRYVLWLALGTCKLPVGVGVTSLFRQWVCNCEVRSIWFKLYSEFVWHQLTEIHVTLFLFRAVWRVLPWNCWHSILGWPVRGELLGFKGIKSWGYSDWL